MIPHMERFHMQTLYVLNDQRIGPTPLYWGADQANKRDHDRRMARGCRICGSAVPGRVCPDCYACLSCEQACDECAPVKG
jgi:hypothetical protein